MAFEDVDGRHPGPDDTTLVLDALADLPRITEASLLPRLSDELRPDSTSWERLSEAGATGEHLVHLDCRADNFLVDASAHVWLVDWPWASVGAPWFDSVTYLLDVLVRDPRRDVEGHLLHDSLREVPPEAVDAVLAGLAGSWTEALQTPRRRTCRPCASSDGERPRPPWGG